MGDVQLPLRLSTSFYIDLSTATSLDGILSSSPVSAPLRRPSSSSSTRKFKILGHTIFKSFNKQRPHGPKGEPAKKAPTKLRWPFFRTAGSKGSESSSPASSISPTSVHTKELDLQENSSDEEDGDPQIKRDDKHEEKIAGDVPEEEAKCDPVGSFDDISEILRYIGVGDDDIMKKPGEESPADEDGGWEIQPAPPAPPIASRTPYAVATYAGGLMRKDHTHLALKLVLTRFSSAEPVAIFLNKMVRAISFSQGLLSGMLSDAKRSAVLMAALELRVMAGRSRRRRGRDQELCNKKILMGKKCQPLDSEDSVYGDDGGRQMVAVARPASPPEDIILEISPPEDFILEISLRPNGHIVERWSFDRVMEGGG